MKKLLKEQVDAVKALAVDYAAFTNANAAGDVAGKLAWGVLLVKSQEALGVELIEGALLQAIIKYAREDFAKGGF